MSRRYLRPGVLVGHLLVLAAALTCLRLGWWQWGVSHQARGTAQNLGYALLWPVFAGAFIYMWLRFLHLESVRDAELAELTEAAPADGGDHPAGERAVSGDGMSGAGVPGGDGMSTDGGGTGGAELLAQPTAPDHAVAGPSSGAAVEQPAPDPAPPEHPALAEVPTPAAPDPAPAGDPAPAADREPDDPAGSRRRRAHRPPPQAYTIAVATVGGDDDEDDPELAAYNRALAALAEQDRRRAR